MMTYEPKQTHNRDHHPDLDMEVYFTLHDDGDGFIIHDRPFQQTLSWIEYDTTNGRLDFIMDDGDVRNFGIPVAPEFGVYLRNIQNIAIVLMIEGKAVGGEELPLIIHHAQ